MKFDESMLSGYLDGELTADEMDVVERQLEYSAQHRRTLLALAELKSQLASLPEEAFAVDPVVAVRQRIEASAGAVHARPIGAGDTAPAGSPHLDTPSMRHRRSVAWRWIVPLTIAASTAVIIVASLRQSSMVAIGDASPQYVTQAAPRDSRRVENLFTEAGPDTTTASDAEAPANEPALAAPSAPPPPAERDDKPADARLSLQRRSTDTGPESAFNQPGAARRLSERTRAYYMAQVDGLGQMGRIATTDAQPSPERSITFDVPAGATERTLRWIADRLGVDEADVDASPDRITSLGVTTPAGTSEPADTAPASVAIRVEAPPEALSGLVQSLRQFLSESGGAEDASEMRGGMGGGFGSPGLVGRDNARGLLLPRDPARNMELGADAARAVSEGRVWIILRTEPPAAEP